MYTFMPCTIDTTAIRNVTPISTPTSEKKLLSFWARMDDSASLTASKNGISGGRFRWTRGGVVRSLSTRPSRSTTTRWACAAISGSWVTSTTVCPWACSAPKTRMISSLVVESRLPVGSSASRIEGSFTSARAIATRWRWPPESSLGL